MITTAAAVSDAAALGWLIGPSIGVLGALLGTVVGARLTGRLHRRQWQREWMTGRIDESLRFAADVCRAIDTILVVYGQCADAVAGKRRLVPNERVEAADTAWRDVLSTRRVYAHEGLQKALGEFDKARAESAEATNSQDASAISLASQRLEARHLQVLDEIQRSRNWINESIGEHILPWPVTWWRALRAHPVYPHAPLPSERLNEAGGGSGV